MIEEEMVVTIPPSLLLLNYPSHSSARVYMTFRYCLAPPFLVTASLTAPLMSAIVLLSRTMALIKGAVREAITKKGGAKSNMKKL
jgi:hypothetical protein